MLLFCTPREWQRSFILPALNGLVNCPRGDLSLCCFTFWNFVSFCPSITVSQLIQLVDARATQQSTVVFRGSSGEWLKENTVSRPSGHGQVGKQPQKCRSVSVSPLAISTLFTLSEGTDMNCFNKLFLPKKWSGFFVFFKVPSRSRWEDKLS